MFSDTDTPKGLQHYTSLIAQRAKIHYPNEFFVLMFFFHSLNSFDYAKEFPIALEEMGGDLISGKLKRHYHKIEGGIEEAPKALPMLF